MRIFRIVAGCLIWLAAVGVSWWYVSEQLIGEGRVPETLPAELWQHVAGERQPALLKSDEWLWVGVGDPIFLKDGDRFIRIGEIREVRDEQQEGVAVRKTWPREAEAVFYSGAPAIPRGAHVRYHEAQGSMGWVVQTMMPPAKREQIVGRINAAYDAHHTEILAELRPVIEQSMQDALAVIEQELPAVLAKHQDELQDVGAHYQRELIEEAILPLVKEEIWPVVRKRSEPTAYRLGRDIWGRVSVWRFGWRFLADKAPFTDGDRVNREWRRFLTNEAMPIIESYTDEFIEVTKEVLSEAARNDKVRKVVREGFREIIEDKRLQRVVWKIIREVMVDNPRLREAMEAHWSTSEARAAIQLASDRMEPTVVEIGELLFGTEETGITPEFARVLRHQILFKDRRWFVLELPADGDAAALLASDGDERIVLPMYDGGMADRDPFSPRELPVDERNEPSP